MEDRVYVLPSGNTVRVAAHRIAVVDASGETVAFRQTRDITTVRRDGTAVSILASGQDVLRLVTASAADAQDLEASVNHVRPAAPQHVTVEVKRGRRVWPWILGGTLGVGILFCVLVAVAINQGNSGGDGFDVEYKVTTRGSTIPIGASLTLSNASGGTEQISSASLPWERSYTMDRFDHMYISAQNKGNGTIRCEIWVDGELKHESESRGEFTIATCNGLVGS